MNATTRLTRAGGLAHVKCLDDAISHFFDHYLEHHPEGYHDRVLIYVQSASSLPEAIERACAGLTSDGVKFRHDQYLRSSSVEILRQRLLENIDAITTARTFDALHDLINSLRPKWIGHLKMFDVSMRLGTWLKINLEESNYVYLHRGALEGWQQMTGQRAKPYRVHLNTMPAALQMLPHYLIEDFLCEFRDWKHFKSPADRSLIHATSRICTTK